MAKPGKSDSKSQDASPQDAVVLVSAKPERGRWRAGRQFTREETTIPLAELSDEQLAALKGDPELNVALQAAKAGGQA